jgi:hypothetical protein
MPDSSRKNQAHDSEVAVDSTNDGLEGWTPWDTTDLLLGVLIIAVPDYISLLGTRLSQSQEILQEPNVAAIGVFIDSGDERLDNQQGHTEHHDIPDIDHFRTTRPCDDSDASL